MPSLVGIVFLKNVKMWIHSHRMREIGVRAPCQVAKKGNNNLTAKRARQKVWVSSILGCNHINGCPISQKVWHANRILTAQWPWVMSICRSEFTSFHMQWWPRHIKRQTVYSSNKLCQITDKIVELKYVSNYFDPSHHRNPLYAFQIFIHSRQNIQKYTCATLLRISCLHNHAFTINSCGIKKKIFLTRGSSLESN